MIKRKDRVNCDHPEEDRDHLGPDRFTCYNCWTFIVLIDKESADRVNCDCCGTEMNDNPELFYRYTCFSCALGCKKKGECV